MTAAGVLCTAFRSPKISGRVVISGPQGFERAVLFALDEESAVITERVRETIDE
jgi:hypothetical protein